MIRVFSKGLDAAGLKRIQSAQHTEKIIISDTCGANTTKQSAASVSNYGDFLCLFITGSFETLMAFTESDGVLTPDPAGEIIDTGVDYLKGQLVDGVGQRKLFTDFIPYHLWLTPGRRRSPNPDVLNSFADFTFGSAVLPASPESNSLFYPLEFEYIFSNSSQIIVNVQNSSNVELSYDIVFHGIRILNRQAVTGIPNV